MITSDSESILTRRKHFMHLAQSTVVSQLPHVSNNMSVDLKPDFFMAVLMVSLELNLNFL